jgi:hypothetical protein
MSEQRIDPVDVACEQCGLTPEQAKYKKSCLDHQSFTPVVPRWNPALGEDRIELHWYGWGGPIEELPPLCDLTRAQADRLVQALRSLLEIDPGADDDA